MPKINLNKLIVYDIETLVNCFIICCKDYKTGSKKEFIIYNDKQFDNQPVELLRFMKNSIKAGYTFVGFNNLGFDAQVLTYFYEWATQKRDPLINFENDFIITALYDKAQSIIQLQDSPDKFKNLYSEQDLFAPQIDIFKQLHYDRPQKATSLKWVQFSMRYPTIEEMPIGHDEKISKEDINTVLEYCWNDVDSTFEFFNKVKFETELRIQLGEEYQVDITNASEPKMVRDIFGKFLCKEMDLPYSKLRKMQTVRKYVNLKDVIFPYVKFQTKEFKDVLDVFNKVSVACAPGHEPKEESKFAYTFRFRDMEVALGLGGIHACVKSGIYEPKENEVLEDADGTSFYPMLAIKNNLRPEHLGSAFNVVYPMMFAERQKYDKKDPRNYVFKIILNSAYGLSKEINSYLYDPKFTYGITINGQLSLLMLVEALSMSVPDIRFLQMNTDGVTYIYDKKHTEMVRKICAWWEKTTKINLEYAYYKKMVIMDVNNYMAIYTNGSAKKKGLFETEMPFHKNPSSLIIPKALEQYFLNNLTPKEFIFNKENSIFDFCNGTKKKSNFKLNLLRNFGGIEIIEEQQKVTRYIISKQTDNSGLLVKDFNDGRRIAVEANKLVIPLNKINESNLKAIDYPIDFDYYLKETNKLIELIEPSVKQTTLF